jgi:hypothetical protein
MASSAFVALCAITSAAATFTHERFSLVPSTSLSTSFLPVAEHVVSFTAKAPRRAHKKDALRSLRKGKGAGSAANYTDVLNGSDEDQEYLTAITIGGQSERIFVYDH